jgi:hypothetical protein
MYITINWFMYDRHNKKGRREPGPGQTIQK